MEVVEKIEAVEVLSNQAKIKFLKRYTLLDKEIDRKVSEIEHWRKRIGKVTAVYTSQPKGGGTIYDRTEEIIIKIVDLENEVNADIDRLISLKAEIFRVIETVGDDRERLLLQYRYLDGRTFEEIAVLMHYSWRQIHRLHSQALSSVEIATMS